MDRLHLDPALNVDALAEAPERLIELTQDQLYAIPLDDQREIQRRAVRKRFADLVHKVPMLTRLAEEQGVSAIESLEAAAPLLLPHSALKSYPLAYLEKSQFARLTRWLNGFTTYDLSTVDAGTCDCIDDWLDLLDTQTDVRVLHSTGTTGKISLLPRGVVEMRRMVTIYRSRFEAFGGEPRPLSTPVGETPYIYCGYRRGGMGTHRLMDFLEAEVYGGDAGMIAAANPGRFSADVASISGRLRVAEAKGELGSLRISPKLLERRDQYLEEQKNAPAVMDAFLASVVERWGGRTVILNGPPPLLHSLAVDGLARGYEGVFAAGSYLPLIGGTKGRTLPDDWRETVGRFFGAERMQENYGMTELCGPTALCPCGHFHLPTWVVPFVLDPDTGKAAPRTGEHKGRFGFVDLNVETYWGAFLTGDEVTLNWGDQTPCGCGRIGPYLGRQIRRYSEAEGGDDKITCAGAPDAHDKALDFIIDQAG